MLRSALKEKNSKRTPKFRFLKILGEVLFSNKIWDHNFKK